MSNVERTKIFDDAKSQEAAFVSSLRDVLECLVNPLNVRDTPFKRSFLSDPVVALSLNLLFEIHKACANFYYALVTVKNDGDIASAYSHFAPSLQLFAQYTAENSKFINAVERNRKSITQCLTREMDFIPVLFEPLNHYPKYRSLYQEFVRHTAETNKDHAALLSALNDIVHQSEYVDVKLQEEKDSLLLLHLQNQFSGNAVIFTPTRKLLREGDVERIRINKKGEVDTKAYYAHLFNDCIVFSTRRITGSYKLHSMFDFKTAEVSKYENTSVSNGFKIGPKDDPEKAEDYRLLTEEIYNDWFQIIIEQIDLLKTKRIAKRTSTMNMNNKTPAIAGVQPEKLGPRCSKLYNFLMEEQQFVEVVNAINTTMIQPLMDAAKGAVLSAALPNTDGDSEARYDNNVANFEKSAVNTTKYQAQVVTDALKEADVMIFLRAAEAIARAVREFVKTVEQQCSSANWGESLIIGPTFNSVTAMSLYNQFKSYSSGQQAMLRVLRTPPFAPFYIDVENYLGGYPGTLQEKIELPRKRVNVYLSVIQDIFALTPQTHPDHFAIKSSLQSVDTIEKDIVELIRMKKNFEKLLEIQNSLTTFSTDPFVQKITTMERNFILEGDLKKVCRKKNKPFRFWLFNDYVIYGAAVGTDSFSFNRALELSKCSIAANTTEKNAIEIYGAEKSFVVIAPTEEKCKLWLDALTSACAKARAAAGVTAVEAAPLWKPDSECNNCPLCDKAFTFWNRKHHCRKCGGLMCSDHLKSTEIIPHIHKTQKQKVCDDCVSGKNAKVVAPSLPPAPVATSSAVASEPVHTSLRATAPTRTPPPVPSTPPPASTIAVPPAVPQSVPPPIPSTPPPVDAPTSPPPPVPVSTLSPSDANTQSNPISGNKLTARYTANANPNKEEIDKKLPPKPVVGKRSSLIASRIAQAKDKLASSSTENVEESKSNDKPLIVNTPSVPESAVEIAPPAQSASAPASPIPPQAAHSSPNPPQAASSSLPNPSQAAPSSPNPPQTAPVRSPPPPPPSRPSSVVLPNPPTSTDSSAKPTAPAAARPPPPPPPTKGGAPAPPTTTRSGPPPPPAPARPVSQAVSVDDEVDDPLRKYKKMKEMLPEGAVRQKMTVDGFSDEDITKFLSGMQISLPMASASVPPPSVTLKAPAPSASPSGPPKLSLLDEIQRGSKLKAVQAEDPRAKQPEPAQNAGGILGMLAQEMSKRRFNMNVDAEDDDSDSSGFSDSDSDSD